MDSFETWLEYHLKVFREDRDNLFKQHNLDKEKVYEEGSFNTLPVAILKKVCYVDAYASILANYQNMKEEESQ